MKIVFVGDVHGEFYILEKIEKVRQPDMIIQCGDFGFWPEALTYNWEINGGEYSFYPLKRIGCPVLFCDGNHEDHHSLRNLPENGMLPETNVRYMRRGSTIDLPDGRTILFMGGAISIDKGLRTEGVDWFPEETISYKDMMNLPDKKIDIVVSHTCPESWVKDISGTNGMYIDNDPSREALQQILDLYHPPLWFFGHWHYRMNGDYKDTHWIALDMVFDGSCFGIEPFFYEMEV